MPSPLGARCRSPLGGLYRSPLGALGCPGGCPDALEVTLSGVDAAFCSGCKPFLNGSQKYQGISYDGVYTVPRTVSGPVSQYLYTSSSVGSNDVRIYGGFGDTTCVTETQQNVSTGIRIAVLCEAGKITSITVGAGSGGSINIFQNTSGPHNLGDAISNSNVCSVTLMSPISSGGTATAIKS